LLNLDAGPPRAVVIASARPPSRGDSQVARVMAGRAGDCRSSGSCGSVRSCGSRRAGLPRRSASGAKAGRRIASRGFAFG